MSQMSDRLAHSRHGVPERETPLTKTTPLPAGTRNDVPVGDVPFTGGRNSTDGDEWKPLPGWPHVVAKHGGLIRSPAGRILKDRPSNRPLGPGPKYRLVDLVANGKRKTVTVHTCVLRAHVGEPEPGQVACHKDDVPDHNDLDNLVWGTPPENEQMKDPAKRAAIARYARSVQLQRVEQVSREPSALARRPWWRRLSRYAPWRKSPR